MHKYRSLYHTTTIALYNFLLAMVGFVLCRIIFILENRRFFTDLDFSKLSILFKGGFYFDLSALLYTNMVYMVLMLIPFHYKEGKLYQKITKGIFVSTNLIAIVMNLADTVYFQYTNRRTTATVFKEFANEKNLGSIVGKELITHWYFVLLAIAMGYALYKFYCKLRQSEAICFPLYYLTHGITFVILSYLCVGGMRGGFEHSVRPITISNANQYVDTPIETAIVLNTGKYGRRPVNTFSSVSKRIGIGQTFFHQRVQKRSIAFVCTAVHIFIKIPGIFFAETFQYHYNYI
ncbi:hypothetical protein EZS27_015946 [termite gut metagenome]|uniref:Lipoteichoic acid synthase 1 n=1 Tax=termite gut metagenome TaxID=433724 RepID=A0A5J4RS84_9ZZZZ